MYANWLWHRPLQLLIHAGEGLQLALGSNVFTPSWLALTHGHSDHVLGLPGLQAARKFGKGATDRPITILFPEVRALPAIVARVKRVFDLGADIVTIDQHLARDPKLAPLIARRPGLRAPGDWDHDAPPADRRVNAPSAWRPWHAYAEQHLRVAGHA